MRLHHLPANAGSPQRVREAIAPYAVSASAEASSDSSAATSCRSYALKKGKKMMRPNSVPSGASSRFCHAIVGRNSCRPNGMFMSSMIWPGWKKPIMYPAYARSG